MSTLTVTNIKATGETASRAVSGVAAAWINFNALTGSPVIQDSFNVASITDSGVGNYTTNFTNSMSNALYVGTVGTGSVAASNRDASVDGIASTGLSHQAYNNSNTNADWQFNFSMAHGDLA